MLMSRVKDVLTELRSPKANRDVWIERFLEVPSASYDRKLSVDVCCVFFDYVRDAINSGDCIIRVVDPSVSTLVRGMSSKKVGKPITFEMSKTDTMAIYIRKDNLGGLDCNVVSCVFNTTNNANLERGIGFLEIAFLPDHMGITVHIVNGDMNATHVIWAKTLQEMGSVACRQYELKLVEQLIEDRHVTRINKKTNSINKELSKRERRKDIDYTYATIDVNKDIVASNTVSMNTGTGGKRRLHTVGAHLRIKNHKIEMVRSHLRGSAKVGAMLPKVTKVIASEGE